MLRLRYFPKLSAGQNNKKFTRNSILLSFATGGLFLPPGVWNDSGQLTSLPQPASCSPPPPRRPCSQPACSSSCLPPTRPVWTPSFHPTELQEGERRTRQPLISFPSASPPPSDRCVRRMVNKGKENPGSRKLNFLETSGIRDAKNWREGSR